MIWQTGLCRNDMLRVLMTVIILVTASCGSGENNVPPTVRRVNITVQAAALRDVKITESAVGKILNPRSVMVSAEIPARVAWIGVDAGSFVGKNDVLVRLDSHDFRAQVVAARAETASLEVKIPARKRLVERYKKLAAGKFISPTMLDHAEAELAALIQSKRAAIARHERARLNLAHTIVRAPISGQVQQRFVAAGDYVKAGTKLLDIIAGGQLTISLPFPETKEGMIHVGQHALLHLPAGGKVLHALIRNLSPMIGEGSGAFEARLKVKNPGGWRPGGSVLAEVQIAEHKHAVVVPDTSVVLRPKGEVVYVISDGKAFERPVESGVHTGSGVEIVRGLKVGEAIAVDGASFLSNGAAVHILDPKQEISEKGGESSE